MEAGYCWEVAEDSPPWSKSSTGAECLGPEGLPGTGRHCWMSMKTFPASRRVAKRAAE